MIDFHCHILPSLDDGACSVDDSITMARLLADFGYQTVCCTPHCIKGYYDLTPQQVREATLILQADLDNFDIHLQLWPGMEYMLDECFVDYAEELLPLGDTRLILCEAPQLAHPGVVQEGLELIIEKGFVPLIAHPERTEHFFEMLTQLVAGGASREKTEDQPDTAFEGSAPPRGFIKRLFSPRATRHAPRKVSTPDATRPAFPQTCIFQANLGSFTGYYGPRIQRQAYALLKQGVYSALASDLHDGSSAAKVLGHDKFETNPLLKKLADWDGVAPPVEPIARSGAGRQGELF